MPLVLGAGAIAFIFLALLTIITLYWVLTQWHNFAQQIPVVGKGLADLGDYLRARNRELLQNVINVAHAVVSWSIDRVHDGFQILNNLYNATIFAQIPLMVSRIQGLEKWVSTYLIPNVVNLQNSVRAIQILYTGFVKLNIDALNFWRSQVTAQINTFVIPSINALINRLDYVTGLQIPTIQARLGVAEKTITQTLPAEIAETKTDVGAVQRELARTTTAPGTGLLDRTLALEKGLAQVLPWAAAIGLSIPIARSLARVGRNPCTCLEEDGQTDLLPLVMYLFEDAG